MKKVNFNNLENMQIPDLWADKALTIPTNQAKTVTLFFARWSRVALAVMSITLVCVIGVLVFFFSQNENVAPKKPHNQNETASMSNTNEATDPNMDSKSENLTETGEIVAQPQEQTQVLTTPTEKQTQAQTHPTEKETQSVNPTEKPTDPSVVVPTQPTTTETTQPTDPVEEPTQAPSDNVDKWNMFVSAQFPKKLVLSDMKIYCRVYDSSNVMLGNSNLYDNSHLTQLWFIPWAKAEYYPYRHNLITKADTYTFVFYNSDGVVAATEKIDLCP